MHLINSTTAKKYNNPETDLWLVNNNKIDNFWTGMARFGLCKSLGKWWDKVIDDFSEPKP